MKEFYDEVERIGQRVGTVRSIEGTYSVAAGMQQHQHHQQPTGGKGAKSKEVVKPGTGIVNEFVQGQ